MTCGIVLINKYARVTGDVIVTCYRFGTRSRQGVTSSFCLSMTGDEADVEVPCSVTHKLYPQLSVAPVVIAHRRGVPVIQKVHDYEFISADPLDHSGGFSTAERAGSHGDP